MANGKDDKRSKSFDVKKVKFLQSDADNNAEKI